MNLFNKISYGLYLLVSGDGQKNNACIVNTLMQQTSTPEQVSLTVNKQNLTHDYIAKSSICSILLLATDTKFSVFQDFGMRSGKTVDKLHGIPLLKGNNGIPIPNIGGIGFFELKVNQCVDAGTHTVFLCDVTAKNELSDKEPLTYSYYHANIKPKPSVVTETESYACSICGYVHPEKISADFVCPICKHGSEVFESVNSIQSKNNIQKGEFNKMSKFVCSVCGYVHEGSSAPEKCPQCGVPATKFTEQKGEVSWAAEHVVGVASGVRADIIEDLRANFMGECTEVGMYLAMGRVATREGFPEIGAFYEKAAWEEAEHAAKFAELLGEVVTSSTEKNLQLRADAENGATLGKFELAKKAKELNLDAIHDTVHEMAKDEARHGKGFLGLLKRYFNK